MDVDYRLAPVEFLVDRRKGGIAEVLVLITGQQPDAVCLESIEGILDLPETAVYVRWRNDGKETEAAGMVLSHLGAVLVELARKIAGFLDVISIPDAGLSDRQDRGRNPALVHVLERQSRRPLRRGRSSTASGSHHRVDVELGNEMVMHVDPRPGRGRLRSGWRRDPVDGRERPQAQRSRTAGQERSPRRARGQARRLATLAAAEKLASGGIGAHPCLAFIVVWLRQEPTGTADHNRCGRAVPGWANSVRGRWRGVIDVRRMHAHARRTRLGPPTVR